ncbi:MAG TPA: DUF6599 family protein [Pyrinomonadaceae bacterium]|nr:DUF6599 family protein [Pyrinomonadaceae bacterium]
MLYPQFIRFLSVLAFALLLFIPVAGQSLTTDPAAKLLPDKLGEFRAAGPPSKVTLEDSIERGGITSAASRNYVSKDGRRFYVTLVTTVSDSGAYALLTEAKLRAEHFGDDHGTANADIGSAGFSVGNGLANTNLYFFKGRAYASLHEEGKPRNEQALLNFGKTLADALDNGAGEIPVLVRHLPDWQNVQSRVLYAVNQNSLKNQFSNQAVIDAVSFEGGAEAVVASYGPEQLAIVEFNTASLATDNNQRISAKIQELQAQGQPVPSAYRRVGNYAVFVFNAPNQEAADKLIDQVKYQQVVQWLGENPFSYEKATREFTETTLGVFVSVVKASGLALVTCLAVGGLFGTLLFRARRSQQRARAAYSDSDAMLRLNLDELTPESEPGRLLGRGN